MKKMNVTIDHLTKEAVGVTRLDKKPMYIKYALENEELEVDVEFEGKRNAYANIAKIIKANKARCNPSCSVYYKCGGCHLSHMKYEAQLSFKTNEVKKIFKNVGFENVIVHDCIGMDTPYYYRNKVQTPVKKQGKKILAGFYKEDSHEVVAYDKCLVQDDLSNKIVKQVVEAMNENKIGAYDEDKRTGIVRHILIRRARKETMLVLVTNEDSFAGRGNFVNSIRKRLPEITTIVQNVNKRHTNVILGEKENILYGKGFISDDLCGITFKISPKSFYQINKSQCEKLYNKAIDLARLKGNEVVLDAYCGIGTIGMIASKKAKSVIGVEIVEDAIKDAIKNAKANNITNCEFVCADAEDFIVNLEGELDTVFVDPPRKGCSEKFLNALAIRKPKKIVYISCNPETQATDAKYLVEHGYEFKECYPYDMFPQSFHIENIICFTLKEAKKLYKKKTTKYHYNEMTREDIAMFQEKAMESFNRRKKNICDSHIDGA